MAKTRIPAACAAIIVAETVVAAQPPRASAAAEVRAGRLQDVPRSAVARASSSSSVKPDEEPAVADRDGRRNGARLADRCFGRARDLEVVRIREAVADERGLERDDGAAVGERRRDLRRDERRRWATEPLTPAPPFIRAAALPWTL